MEKERNRNSIMFDVIEKMDSMVRVMDSDSNIIYMNKRMRETFGDIRGKKCYEMLRRNGKCNYCVSIECQLSNENTQKDVIIHGRHFRIIASPVSLDRKEKYSVEIFEDITEQKEIEEENRRHYEKLKEDVLFAKQVQHSALPSDGVYWGALKLVSSYEPSEALGGDIFDIFEIDEDHILFYIADVSGHGIRSSLLTIFLRQIIRSMREKAADLNYLLDELIISYSNLITDGEQYFSILAGLYNRKEKKITFVNAGHNCPPLLIREDGTTDEIQIKGMPICSLLKKSGHKKKEAEVSAGDRVLLYTDGISEAYDEKNKRNFGSEKIKEIALKNRLKPEEDLVSELMDEVKEFSNQKSIDDRAIIAIEIL